MSTRIFDQFEQAQDSLTILMELLRKWSSALNSCLLTKESWEVLKSWQSWIFLKDGCRLIFVNFLYWGSSLQVCFWTQGSCKAGLCSQGAELFMTSPTPSNTSPKAITLLLLCQDYVFPYYRRGEQSPKEKGKLVSCQSPGLSQQPPIFNSIANDICDQRARTPGGA